MKRLGTLLLAAWRLLTCEDSLHLALLVGALAGLWYGLERCQGNGWGTVAVSGLTLAGVAYARTRPRPQKKDELPKVVKGDA